MAIYIDANYLWSWRTFTEIDRLAVSIVSAQLGQEIFVASVAAREGEESFRRSLEDSLRGLERARSAVERLFGEPAELGLEPWPDVDGAVRTWRRRLAEMASILPLHDRDAHAALDREITGTPPAKPRETGKPGRGGRDAAIWLTILRHHTAGAQEGHFLTKDGDFSNRRGELHPDLGAEFGRGTPPLRLYTSVSAFVGRLGTPVHGREVTLDELHERARPALEDGLRDSREVPLAVWDELKPELRYRTKITLMNPVEIHDQRRYEQGEHAVVIVNARWHLSTQNAFQERDTAAPEEWRVIHGIDVTADVQVFLEERHGHPEGAQFISAQARSEAGMSIGADGSVEWWETATP